MPGPPLLSRIAVLQVPANELPMLVLTDNMSGWISRKIRKHSHGYYSHVMWMAEPGMVVSQGWTLKQQPIEGWLDGTYRIKLWRNPGWTQQDKNRIRYWLEKQLARPLRERTYDWVGIIGQALKVGSINLPHKKYCSEAAAEVLSKVEPYNKLHPSPADINRWCKASKRMEVYGAYDPDLVED